MTEVAATKLVMIRKTDEFSSVFSFRKRLSNERLVIHYKPNGMEHARVGFVVAKKIAKLAVDRNYMRRVLREQCRQELHRLDSLNEEGINQGVDVVIQVKKPFKNEHFFSLKQELATLFVKIQSRVARENTHA